jgi:hypothetical protein
LAPFCTGNAVIPLAALTIAVPVDQCDLRGRIVSAGAVSVAIPTESGQGVSAHALLEAGAPDQVTELTAQFVDGAITVVAHQPEGSTPGVGTTATAACTQNAWSYSGEKYFGTLGWWLRHGSAPSYYGQTHFDSDAKSAAWNIDHGYNDCGFTQSLGTSTSYKGSTTIDVGINSAGSCIGHDGYNVIAFGPLPSGTLAVTCRFWYWVPIGDNHIFEADIRARNASGLFFFTIPSGCSSKYELEGVLTHEFGHAFGMDHVSESSYPTLTMSPTATACSYQDKSLGKGDYNGLKAHYGG